MGKLDLGDSDDGGVATRAHGRQGAVLEFLGLSCEVDAGNVDAARLRSASPWMATATGS